MPTVAAEPVAFRCSRCFNTNCATSEESGQTVPCRDCGTELQVPDPTPERIQLGHEFVDQFSNLAGGNSAPSQALTFDESPVSDTEVYAAARREVHSKTGPEGLVCSRMRRFLAKAVDGFSFTVAFGISLVLAMIVNGDSQELNPMTVVVWAALPLLLQVMQWCMTAMDGRTIGKYCLNIKVVNLSNQPPGFFQGVFLRTWVTTMLKAIPFFALINICFIFANESKRCIHDFIAGTYVVEAS